MKPSRLLLALVGLSLLAAASIPFSRAADGTWTANADGLWSTGTNWSGASVAGGAGSTADFSTLDITGDRRISLDSDRTLGKLIFGDTTPSHGWTLNNNGNAGNNLILDADDGNTPTIMVNSLGSGKTVTISAIIKGSEGLLKEGSGTLTLSGANTYTGGTTVKLGTVVATSLGANVTGNNISVDAGGNLALGTAASLGSNQAVTVTSTATALGGIGVGGSFSTPAFTNNTGTYGGVYGINYTGTNSITSLATLDSTLNANSGDGTGHWYLGSQTSGTFNGTLAAASDNIYRLGGGGGSLTFSQPNALTGDASLQVGANATNGAGTVILPATNTYTGTTTIANGTLSASNIAVSAGSSTLGNATSAVILGSATTKGTLSYTGNSTTFTRGFTVNPGGGQVDTTTSEQTLTIATGTITGSGPLTIGGAGDTIVSSGIQTGSGTLTKTGNGRLTLAGVNTYTGHTAISGGIVNITGTLGSSANPAGKFTTSGGSAVEWSGTGTVAASDYFGAGDNSSSKINVMAGSLTVASSSLGIFLGNGPSAGGFLYVFGGTVDVAGNGPIRVGAGGYNGGQSNAASALTISGTGVFDTGATAGLFQLGSSTAGNTAGTGTLNLDSGGTLATNRVITSGTVANLAVDGAATAFNFNGGTFKANGDAATLSLNSAGGLGVANVRNGGAVIDTNGYAIAVAQTLQHSTVTGDNAMDGGLTKLGAGTLTLSGANTYTGGTTVSAGTLRVNNSSGSGTGSGAVTVASGATLGGSGTIAGPTTIQSGGTHAPGNSPGLQTFNSGLTYATGSTFTWELAANTDSGRSTSFDGVDVTGGTLTIQTGVTSNLVFNNPGSSVLWSDTFWDSNRSWLVFDNFNAPTLNSLPNIFGTINLSTDSGNNALGSRGSFSWSQSGNDVYLNFLTSAVPEPGTGAVLGLAVGALGLGFRRRRRASS